MRRIAIIAGILAVVFLTTFGIAMALGVMTDTQVSAWFDRLQQSPYAAWLIILLVIGLLAGDVLLPVPATVAMIAAGNLLGTWWGGLASFVGLMLSAVIGYSLCRWGGRAITRKLIKNDDALAARAWFDRYGLLALVVARGLPVLSEVATCMAGLTRINPRKFFLYTLIVSAPFAFLHSFAGAYSTATYPWPALLVLLGVPALAWCIWRRREDA